jgi:phosphoribosylanthranilate isomerase
MTRIKICGITNAEDARLAAQWGADALGFIAVPGTPRYVTPATYEEIAAAVPIFVKRVIVVNRPEDADGYAADYVQHYAEMAENSHFRVDAPRRIRAFRIRDEDSLQELADYPEPLGAALLDGYHREKLGGSGATFDWELAVRAKRLTDTPILLAGGLTPANITAALEAVRPYGVDVSSGVEARPGKKDPEKLRAFLRAVRAWDMQQGLGKSGDCTM